MRMRKNVVQPNTPHDSIIRRMRYACWITEARTNEHSVFTPCQRWLWNVPYDVYARIGARVVRKLRGVGEFGAAAMT